MALKKTEITVILTLFLLILFSLSFLKIVKWNTNQGDSALFSQLIENIILTGTPHSELASNSDYYVMHNNFATLSLEEIRKRDLSLPSADKLLGSFFTFHFNPILYILVPLSFINTDILYPAAIVFSFISMLFIGYLYLRKKEVSILTATLFVLLIMSHPAFSISIQGQLYPDRFFLGIALLFAFLCSNKSRNNLIFVLVAVLGWLVSERSGLILGIFAILHYVLYYKRGDRPAMFKLFIGIILLLSSFIVMKIVINNSNYSGYLIKSISAYINYLNMPGVIEKISIYLLFSSILCVISFFDWRSAIIALIMLLPNLLGNIGGAEKTGWFTHYHTYYFPILIWAGTVGLIKLNRKTKKWIVNILLCLLIVLICTKNPYTIGFSFNNLKENILVKSISEIKFYFIDGNAKQMMDIKREFQNSIPPGSKVSAIESAWYPFYKTAHISYYPIGIKEADYAVIAAQKVNGGYKYGGFISYQGPLVAAEIDKYLLEKMEEYGYDLKNPVYISPWGHAVIARKLNTNTDKKSTIQ